MLSSQKKQDRVPLYLLHSRKNDITTHRVLEVSGLFIEFDWYTTSFVRYLFRLCLSLTMLRLRPCPSYPKWFIMHGSLPSFPAIPLRWLHAIVRGDPTSKFSFPISESPQNSVSQPRWRFEGEGFLISLSLIVRCGAGLNHDTLSRHPIDSSFELVVFLYTQSLL